MWESVMKQEIALWKFKYYDEFLFFYKFPLLDFPIYQVKITEWLTNL